MSIKVRKPDRQGLPVIRIFRCRIFLARNSRPHIFHSHHNRHNPQLFRISMSAESGSLPTRLLKGLNIGDIQDIHRSCAVGQKPEMFQVVSDPVKHQPSTHRPPKIPYGSYPQSEGWRGSVQGRLQSFPVNPFFFSNRIWWISPIR